MRTGAQRAVGRCETVEGNYGTRLGASARKLSVKKVGRAAMAFRLQSE